MPLPTRPHASTDTPPPPGLTLTTDGPQLCVAARHATRVEVVIEDEDGGGRERRIPLRHRAHGLWWDLVPELTPGRRYGLRVDGPWAPTEGHRHNPAKLLLDPYAGGVDGEVDWAPPVFGHVVDADSWRGDPTVRDDRDSAGHVPRSVVIDHDTFDWGQDALPQIPWSETVIYEAHVRGLTMRHPQVPADLRGTYAALGHPAVVEHLTSLGVTTLELLPIHAFTSEPALVRRGLTNYWGYNTLSFFAPHTRYAAAGDPQGAVDELKGAIRALHAAGIEVLLDVVYNHTAEQGGVDGQVLSWRGLDNATYYRLDDRGRDLDMTGCGNTLDLREPRVQQLVLDSLRHWVEQFHVDGFRFDLAPALARGRTDEFDRRQSFLMALRTDPVLSRVKLVAEPWDVGVHGWRTGQFPAPVTEWNDRYRDAVRSFWLGDVRQQLAGGTGSGIAELARRMTGSADLFDRDDRGALGSVNLISAHDGFTAADLTAYEHKHNQANGEDNRDGHGDNRSWNHGVEGPTDDPTVLAVRRRSLRNLLGTLLLSAGIPMITAGDELGRTQHGNNNAYCQDGPTTWLDWDLADWQHELLDDVRALTELRRRYPVLRPVRVPLPEPTEPGSGSGTGTDVAARPGGPPPRVALRWFTETGERVRDAQWRDRTRRTVVAELSAPGCTPVLLVLHAGPDRLEVTLPPGTWSPVWSSDAELLDHLRSGTAGTTSASHLDSPPVCLTVLVSGPSAPPPGDR